MRENLSKLPAVIAVAIALAAPAWGADQNVLANLALNGFQNPGILVAFESSDAFDKVYKCTVETGSSCTAKNGYRFPPKNISNVLCLPNTLSYILTASCQQLLAQGATQKCESNDMADFCTTGYDPDTLAIAPACRWRTNDNKNPVAWNWVLTQGPDPAVTVDCSNSNYKGPQK